MRRARFWRWAGARLPIRWRLALVSFGLLAVLLGALGVLVSLTAEHALLANQAIALHDEARLATMVSGGRAPKLPSGSAPPNASVSAKTIVQRLGGGGTWVAVLSSNGTVLASSNETGLTAPPTITLSATTIRQDLQATQAPDQYLLAEDSAGHRQLVILTRLPLGQHSAAVLEISTPTAPIDRAITTIRLILALGIAGALGIAAALTLPLVGTALRPLREMERASARIADGALSLRLDVPPTNDEIGRLARSFNSMVARLEAAFARQKQFVADVSHELRTPLTALGGSLEMLLLGADGGDREAAQRLMRGMYAEVARMRRLVEDLLTLTRLDEGRARLRAEPIDVAALVSEVCAKAHYLAHGQTIHCAVAAGTPPARGDSDRLQQMLLNILDNALKFTPPSGQVELTARGESEQQVIIAVRDTGEGIPPDALPHVFERFYRADPARARTRERGGGSGLGLAIARSLVEAQGGTITIASALGAGTTVTIRLPAAPPAPLNTAALSHAPRRDELPQKG